MVPLMLQYTKYFCLGKILLYELTINGFDYGCNPRMINNKINPLLQKTKQKRNHDIINLTTRTDLITFFIYFNYTNLNINMNPH